MTPPVRTSFTPTAFLRCALSLVLICTLMIPLAATPRAALADSSINSATNLTWDELKPYLEAGLGVPYVFGGGSPSGWDCSGYVSWVLNTYGGTNYTHYTVTFEQELANRGCFVMEGNGSNLRDERMQPGDIIFFYSEGVPGCTHMGVVGERVDGIVMVYHAFTNSFNDIYGHSGTMLQGLDANPGSSLRGIWYMSSGHGKGNWSKFTVYRGVVSTGSLALNKRTANASITDANVNYTLAGATYGVYASESDAYNYANPVAIMTTDENGFAQHDELNQGRYFVREISPSPGYALDESVYEAPVVGGQTTAYEVHEQPQAQPLSVWLTKYDQETSRSEAQGDASLAKAQFTFTFYGGQYTTLDEAEAARAAGVASRTWTMQTNEQGAIDFTAHDASFPVHDDDGNVIETAPYFVSGDELYTDTAGNIVLPLGTVFVYESQAPEGYLPNESVQGPINLTGSGTNDAIVSYNTPSIPDRVIRGGIAIGKVDRETREHKPLGNATLEGAVFALQNSSPHTVVVNGNDYLPGQTVLTLTTNADGIAQSETEALPYGTYTITEAEAPEGYALDEESRSWSQTVHIREQGVVVDLTSAEDSVPDQVKRGDLSFSKVDEQTMERMANVAFSVTSLTTGETHVIMTDENGMVDTAASWNAHTELTNANDFLLELQDGAVRQSEGQLKEEPPALAKQNSAHEQAPGSVGRAGEASNALQTHENDTQHDQGTPSQDDVDASVQNDDAQQSSKTSNADTQTAASSSADKQSARYLDQHDADSPAKKDDEPLEKDAQDENESDTPEQGGSVANSVDPVDETEDEPDAHEQTASDDETDDAVMGNPLAGVWFSGRNDTATMPNDSLGALPYDTYRIVELPNSANAGKTMAAFTVTITRDHVNLDLGTVDNKPASAIHTTLANEQGEHLAPACDALTLIDTVEYDNLIPGKTYTLSGTLHRSSLDDEGNRTDEGPLNDENGTPVSAQVTFTPDMTHGTVELSFTFDASLLEGSTIVAFETLSSDDTVIAVHADINDDDQTVYIPSIGTTLAPAPQQHASAFGTCTLIDTVSYEHLLPGKTYEMHACLHLKNGDGTDGGIATDESGKPLITQQSFTPEAPSGTVEVSFVFNAPALSGETVVAFEDLTRNGVAYATHADIADRNQSVSFPRIATQAADAADRDQEIDPIEQAQIIDHVSYTNLEAQASYRMVATLHAAAADSEGNIVDLGPVTDDAGHMVKAEQTFTPTQEEGTIDVNITFSAQALGDSTLVVFEECYRDDTLVAQHADITDTGQSIKVKAPRTPEYKQGNPSGGTFSKTGNPLLAYRWVIALITIGGTLAGALALANIAADRKEQQRKSPHPRRP